MREFCNRGARYMSLSYNGHSQLSDSNTGEATNEWMWGGLAPLGRQVIAEMNRCLSAIWGEVALPCDCSAAAVAK